MKNLKALRLYTHTHTDNLEKKRGVVDDTSM